jgi:tetratricopeptide (TPR) repeat protein
MPPGDRANAADLLNEADAHFRAGRIDQATALLARASELEPHNPQILRALGIALVGSNRAGEALPALRRLTELRPDDPTTFHQLGDALAFAGDLSGAADALRKSVGLKPDYAPAWARLGNVLRSQGDDAGAIDAFQHAARLDPAPDIRSNLADALISAVRPGEAVQPLREALRTDPSHLASHVNLSCAYMRLGQMEKALEEIRIAQRLRPDSPRVHYYLALALLKRGDLLQGFEEFEWRFRFPVNHPSERIDRELPRWRGEDLSGKTILLHSEQGLGDAIQFARWIAPVVRCAVGGKTIVACPRTLWDVMKSIAGIDRLIDWAEPLPSGIDFQCPFMSLPLVFKTTMETIPAEPYLRAPAEAVAKWKERLAAVPGRKVGLTWAGKTTNSLNRYRSCHFDDLAPLFDVPGVSFVSLQMGAEAAQMRASPLAEQIIDPSAELSDMAATAALMTNLDLVISVDSAPVHLAGALGRPTWALLSRGADWRWHVDREDSPWYPTMRLFRQNEVNRWDDVMQRVAAELSAIH